MRINRTQVNPNTLRGQLELQVLKVLQRPPESLIYRIFSIAGCVVSIGLVDMATGTRVSLLVFYLMPIALAVAWSGLFAAFATSLFVIFAHLFGDYLVGAHYVHHPIIYWNSLVILTTFMVVAWVIRLLLDLQTELESRVKLRTDALAAEVHAREQLQNKLIEFSESERRKIGNDLHDGLGQHLTALAYAARVLKQQLTAQDSRAGFTAQEIVRLAEHGIQQSRQLARGLLLISVEPSHLSSELHEMITTIEKQTGIHCYYKTNHPPFLSDATVASHLFQIAQEAVRNSIRHAQPKALNVSLLSEANALVLTVSDDGCGLPQNSNNEAGVGLRVMAHRAEIIGGVFTIKSTPGRGTQIRCQVPLSLPAGAMLAAP